MKEKLERVSELPIHWLEDNYMNLNTDNSHLLTSIHRYEHRWTQIGKDMVWEENEVKLLRVTIDTELKFETHISNICSKANKKFSVSCRFKNTFNISAAKGTF